MAFQTHVQQNGEWVTQTVDLSQLLQPPSSASGAQPAPPSAPPTASCGVLARTIVDSPVVHWVLPVQLRTARHNDVAFVGDNSVVVQEFREDGQLHEIGRRSDFGSRILNAGVIGDTPDESPSTGPERPFFVKSEPGRRSLPASAPKLPPQLLALMLECGDIVFLFVRHQPFGGSSIEMCEFRFEPPRRMPVYPGFQMAVDPSSRYMAAATTEGVFVVYELETMETMRHQYASRGIIKPIRRLRPRSIAGFIQKMEFLYPQSGDSEHAILLLIIVQAGKAKMVTYDWKAGDDLDSVLSEAKPGHRLPAEHQMPLLLIPLTVRNSFFAVSQGAIGVFKDVLQGPPECDEIDTAIVPQSELHNGLEDPLWTAWARPFRRKDFHEVRDNIYLAREDGAIIYFEINKIDILNAGVHVCNVQCNISTAFTAIREQFSDVLIACGDSGPGSIWKVPARQPPSRLASLPNWSPTLDFAIANVNLNHSRSAGGKKQSLLGGATPRRLFTTSGMGRQGAITEHRLGIEASIGLDFEYEELVRRLWIFPAATPDGSGGFWILLSMPDCTSVLHLSEGLDEVSVPEGHEAYFDVSSRTLAASRVYDDHVVQISEKGTCIVGSGNCSHYSHSDSMGLCDGVVEKAVVLGDLMTLASHTPGGFRLDVARLGLGTPERLKTINAEAELTCVALLSLVGKVRVLAGHWRDGESILAVYDVEGDDDNAVATLHINKGLFRDNIDEYEALEPLTSIVALGEQQDAMTVVAVATRNGYIVTMNILDEPPFFGSCSVERISPMTLELLPVPPVPAASPWKSSVMASSDSKILLLTNVDTGDRPRFRDKHRIIPVDINDLSTPSVPVDSCFWLGPSLSGRQDHASLLLLSGRRVLMADLGPRVGPVPRHMKLPGSPVRVIHSSHLGCLVVAVQKGGRPDLVFLDPDTGEDLSKPRAKNGDPLEFVAGLGFEGDRVLDLHEWTYLKDGKTFAFIVATTKMGRLLILSAQRVLAAQGGQSASIHYHTRSKVKHPSAVYSVATHAESLIFCVDKTLYWDSLDVAEKKFKNEKSFRLESPATSLQLRGDLIFALTADHSLVVVDRGSSGSGATMQLVQSDQVTRRTSHLINVGEGLGVAPISLVSDRYGKIAGLWSSGVRSEKEFTVLFEGSLPCSVRRFRTGRTRPCWSLADSSRFGRLKSTAEDGEIFGTSLDGALLHFTLLSGELWKFLNFVQTLALSTPSLYPYWHRSRTREAGQDEPWETHAKVTTPIDGAIIESIMQERRLGTLLEMGVDLHRTFRRLLDGLEEGQLTRGFSGQESLTPYIGLAYSIFESLLRQVL